MRAKGTRRIGVLRPHPHRERPFVFMKIVVNGKDMDVVDGLSVEALLAQLGVKREYTAVAVNRDITPKSAYGATVLRSGDKVEIVRPMGGG
jgi:sulfur carrier protein